MHQDVYNYVTSCDICQKVKCDPSARNAPLHPMPVHDALHRWHKDILEGLSTTKECYQYILLMVDSLSHWPEAIPIEKHDAETIAKILYKEVFSRYGAPKVLISNRGKNFMSMLVQSLCDIFNVTRYHTSSYHHKQMPHAKG